MSFARERWEELDSRRDGILDRARQCAELTIPSLLPPEGHEEEHDLPTPYQSLGARGVNNLASKLLLALLPPGNAFFRLDMDDRLAEALGEKQEQVEKGLRKLENRVVKSIEEGTLRSTLFLALKHLIVTPGALVYLPKKGGARMFRIDQFCVLRDADGTVREIVVKEQIHPTSLDEQTREACKVIIDKDGTKQVKPVDVFTHIKLEDGRHVWNQEINDLEVPDSKGSVKADESPWIALRWQGSVGDDYGRPLVEEYLGDLRSLEGLSKAIVAFSALAAKIIFLRKPNSQINAEEMANAESGDIISGDIEDISALILEKYPDFQVTKATLDDLTLRLSHAFLLQSGTVRDAERVTAEEIREMAQELEDVLGGVYTVLTQELQLPLVKRILSVMKSKGEFPKLPKVKGQDAIKPIIVTGFDALGRGHELNRLRQMIGDIGAVKPAALEMFRDEWLIEMFAIGHNVDISDALKSDEDMQAEQQQAMVQDVASKAAGPVAGQLAKGMTEN
jgi:hypothetical protein